MSDERKKQPPHLALVLGSGGVRSIAALGIAEVFAAKACHLGLPSHAIGLRGGPLMASAAQRRGA